MSTINPDHLERGLVYGVWIGDLSIRRGVKKEIGNISHGVCREAKIGRV